MINRAIALVEEEIDLIRRERDALDRFLVRLRDTESDSFDSTGHGLGLVTGVTGTSDGLRTVRRAYRETVMATPHYESEYGDTLRESLASEVGAPLARHVMDGDALTPKLHGALVQASEQSRDDRDDFLRVLCRERDSLRNVETQLNSIESCVVELRERLSTEPESTQLADINETLETLEGRCTDLANCRQDTIHNRCLRKTSGVGDGSLVWYLYSDMETVTPALSDIASCLDKIRHQRMRCLQ